MGEEREVENLAKKIASENKWEIHWTQRQLGFFGATQVNKTLQYTSSDWEFPWITVRKEHDSKSQTQTHHVIKSLHCLPWPFPTGLFLCCPAETSMVSAVVGRSPPRRYMCDSGPALTPSSCCRLCSELKQRRNSGLAIKTKTREESCCGSACSELWSVGEGAGGDQAPGSSIS